MRTALTRCSRPTGLLGALALLMIATLAVVAHPQPADAAPTSTDFTVGVDQGLFNAFDDVASNGTKSLVVYSKFSVNSRYHVWAVLMNAGGGAASNPIRIDKRATDSYEPHVAWNGTNFLVVWTYNFKDDGSDTDIRGQLVTPSGSLLGTEIPIANALTRAHWPAVAAGPNGTFEVAWNERHSNDLWADLDIVPLSSGGGLGQQKTLRTHVGAAADDLIWVSGAQRFVVTYPDDGGRDFAVFDAAGTFLGGQEIGPHETPFPLWPSPTSLATDGNRVLAVYALLNVGITAMWIDPQPIGHSDPFRLPSSGSSGLPDVAFNGIFLVVWAQETQTSPNTEKWALKAARVKPDGTVMDTTASTVSSIPDLELLPTLSRGTSTAGSFTLAWQNGHPTGDTSVDGIVFTAGVKAATK